MRSFEILGGLQMMLGSEEQMLVNYIRNNEGVVLKKNLQERQQELARTMVTRGVLIRVKIDEELGFKVNELEDVWRDK